MDRNDKRSGRVVFMSQCLLNQNLRFPGIAVARGACADLVRLFMDQGIGIEPIPCLERIGWGGVSRKKYFRYQPLLLAQLPRPLEALVRMGARAWMMKYARHCRAEAETIAGHIRDYCAAGYEILGIIGVNDSPTDGVTKTIDLLSSAGRMKAMGIDTGTLSNPAYESMKDLIPSLCTDGPGIFITELKRILEHGGIQTTFVGYDPWRDPLNETERIAKHFNLRHQ